MYSALGRGNHVYSICSGLVKINIRFIRSCLLCEILYGWVFALCENPVGQFARFAWLWHDNSFTPMSMLIIVGNVVKSVSEAVEQGTERNCEESERGSFLLYLGDHHNVPMAKTWLKPWLDRHQTAHCVGGKKSFLNLWINRQRTGHCVCGKEPWSLSG